MSDQTIDATVIHSLPYWLPLTSPWLYHQVVYLPPSIRNLIVCEWKENLDQFGLPGISALEDRPRWERLREKVLRRLRWRQHLGLLVETGRRERATLVHSHWGDMGWRDRGALQRLQIPHVVTFYGKDVNYLPQFPKWRVRYQALFKGIDRVLCEGRHMADMIEALGCAPEKVRVHHLGVEVSRIAFKPRTWQPGEPLRVLIAASFREKKGIPYALEALGRLLTRVPDLELTIIGDASADARSHPEKEKILDLLNKTGLLAKTRMLGYQPHNVLFEEAYRHHIFISPSVTAQDGDTEGGAPVTLIDLAATGMPLVSTFHCDIPDVILDGKTGLLAKERDVDGLERHLDWLVAHPEAWRTMLEAGRTHVEREYEVVGQGEKLKNIYLELLKSRSRGPSVGVM